MIKKVFCCFLLILFFLNAFSQSIVFKQFLIDKENTNINYNTIYFDTNGMMWIGTSQGLYQYDGENFILYTVNQKNFDNEVTAICSDNKNTIWVGYNNGKIASINQDSLRILNSDEGLPAKPITSIMRDNKGTMWITTAGEGVYFYLDKRFYNINKDDGLTDDFTYKAIEDNDGNIWIGTDQGISICKAEPKRKVINKINYSHGLPDEIIRDLVKDNAGNIWIGTQDKGVCKYLWQQKKIELPAGFINWNYGQINNMILTDNDCWIATQDNGLINYNPIKDKIVKAYSTYDKFKFSNINHIIRDNEGNIWSAGSSGLIMSLGNALTYLNHVNDKKLAFVHTILSVPQGQLYFSPDQQLSRIQFRNGISTIKNYVVTSNTKLIDIVSLYQDRCSYVWIGTMGAGLYRLNPESGVTQKMNGLKELDNASILSIDGRNNELWMATLGGVIKCNIPSNCNSDVIEPMFSGLETQKEIGNYFVYKVFVDSKKRVWFGTDGKGITCYDGKTFINYNKSHGLKSDVVYSITEDDKGAVWFSTLDAGIYKYDGKKFSNYTTDSGLAENTCSSIIYAGNNNLVIVNQRGINVLNTETETIQFIKPENDFETSNADLNSITRDAEGNVWIGTEEGIIRYNSRYRITSASAVPVIKKASVISDELFILNGDELKYNQNNISIDFAGLWYTDPERVNYQYKLEGYNKHWVSTKDKRIIFPDLPPGNYVFKLKASAINNFISANQTSLTFTVNNPMWKEWWFQILGFSLLIFIVLGYLKSREKNINKLQTLEREKIKFQLDTLKSQVNPHFLFNSFNTLISIIENDKQVAVEYVEHLSEFFRNLVNYRDKDFITLSEEMKLSFSYFFLQQKRFGKNLTMKITIENGKNELLVPPLVVQILIENAIKHNAVSKETPLVIHIYTEGNRLLVCNTINEKRSAEPSTKTGLENIRNRYKLLTREEIVINKNDSSFIVSLPLIKDSKHESTDY